MRWAGQEVNAEPGAQLPLLGMPGLVRTVQTPEFAGITFHEVAAKSVLNRVPGSSPMPFRWTVNPYRGCSHACVYCLVGDTPVLLADGGARPIGDLRTGDLVYGTVPDGPRRRYVTTEVLAHWSTLRRAYRVRLAGGTELVASGDHRFLGEHGWRYVAAAPDGCAPLTPGYQLAGTGRAVAAVEQNGDYRRGYLCGIVRGESGGAAGARARGYLEGFGVSNDHALQELIRWPTIGDDRWYAGFLAGILDAAGSSTGGQVRIRRTDPEIVHWVMAGLKHHQVEFAVEDPGHPTGLRSVCLDGVDAALRLRQLVDPAIPRSVGGAPVPSSARSRVAAVEDLGVELPMFDITTGTGDFVADGVISHNCFARNSHTYLDLDAGADFDSQVVVKVNAAEVLGRELRSPKWAREQVAMGTNTDPYQRAEGRYRLLPGIIGALARSGTPMSILTKGTLLGRDLPELAAAARDVPVGLGVSLALLDRSLHPTLEPGTPSPQARLALVRRVREAGLPCGVFVAPVLPWLTDRTEQLDLLLARIADAGATGVTVVPLHLRPGTREWFLAWLGREHPELVAGYQRLYARGSNADRRYRQDLAARVAPLLRRHGLAGNRGRDATGIPGDDDASWPAGSMPPRHGGDGETPVGEQLRLL